MITPSLTLTLEYIHAVHPRRTSSLPKSVKRCETVRTHEDKPRLGSIRSLSSPSLAASPRVHKHTACTRQEIRLTGCRLFFSFPLPPLAARTRSRPKKKKDPQRIFSKNHHLASTRTYVTHATCALIAGEKAPAPPAAATAAHASGAFRRLEIGKGGRLRTRGGVHESGARRQCLGEKRSSQPASQPARQCATVVAEQRAAYGYANDPPHRINNLPRAHPPSSSFTRPPS